MQTITVLAMSFLGFPVAFVAAEVRRDGEWLKARQPRARKWRAMKPDGVRLLAGDQTAAVKAAVWAPTADGHGETTRYHSFAPEWGPVVEGLAKECGEVSL